MLNSSRILELSNKKHQLRKIIKAILLIPIDISSLTKLLASWLAKLIDISCLIYKENYAISDITILPFHESLMRSLTLGMSFEKLKFELR